MSARTFELTRRFYAWERGGRGWDRYPYPVEIEPPFRFPDWHYRPSAPVDDGRRETLLSRIFRRRPAPVPVVIEEAEVLPDAFAWAKPPEELTILLPPEASVPLDASAAWLSGLATLSAPLAVELIGYGGEVEERIVCAGRDVRLLSSSLQGIAPGIVLAPAARPLTALRDEATDDEAFYAVLEFGLGREFVIPLGGHAAARLDPLAPFVAALADLSNGELGLFQVFFTPARAPWPEAVHAAVVTPTGQPFFADDPGVTRQAEEKTASPMFAAVLRTASLASSPDRAFEIVRGLAGGLARLGSPSGNELIPLSSENSGELLLDVLTRTTHRTGMLLSADELALLAKLPGKREETPALRRLTPGKLAPVRFTEDRSGLLLGENRVQGQARPVYLPIADRLRHVHVVGASGTGKSTLLVRTILQDIQAGRGVGVLDPHGDLVDDVLARIPEERAKDVVVFDPSDAEAVVGWNLLSAGGEAERQMLASDLVAVFQRLSTSWGDQMTSVLANTVLAFLDSPRGGTLLELRRFLVDKAFRDAFLRSVRDPHLRSFWKTEFPMLVGRRPQGPILTRLDTLLRHRLVREVVTAREKPLDFRAVVSEGKVFLARLAQGAIGRENAALLGSLLLSTFHQVALARQDTPEAERRPFFLYLDEAHELATPSLASMLSGTRKFGLGLVVAHQDLYQLRAAAPDVERAVLANAHTRIVFRVGTDDARTLASGFSGFAPENLTALPIGGAVCRVGGSLDDFNLSTVPLPGIDAATARARRERIVERSREKWGTPRDALREVPSDVEAPAEVAAPPEQAALPRPPAKRKVAPPAKPEAPEPPETAEPPVEEEVARSKLPRPTPPPTAGRGGPEHRYLQSLIREWAQARGYRADVEVELEGGGRVDLVITRPAEAGSSERIACEVSVTTDPGHEIENVRKCLAAGFDRVFLVTLKQRLIHAVEKVLETELEGEERARVAVVPPEALMVWLDAQPASERTTLGYTVTTQTRAPGAGEAEARRARLASIVSESLSRQRRK